MFDLSPLEWMAVGLVASTIVLVNKLAIQDRGSTWAGLLLVAFSAGLALVHANRSIRRRTLRERSAN